MNKKTIALATAGVIAMGTTIVGANYASQLDTSTALVEQLGGIARRYKEANGGLDNRITELETQKGNYEERIRALYQATGQQPPTDLSQLTNQDITNLINGYTSQNVGNAESQTEARIFSDLSEKLGTTVANADDVKSYIDSLVQQSEAGANTEKLEVLRAVYDRIENYNISDSDLLSKSSNDIKQDIWSYVNEQTASASQTASGVASEQATQEAVSRLAEALRMDTSGDKTYTLDQVVAEASRIRKAYSKSCQDLSDMSASQSTATADMQETIQALRQQIQDLGETPCK